MRILRRTILFTALIALIICGLLLLNITAPNPTGRRYSSDIVSYTAGSQVIGRQGENALARDLNLPRNEESDQRACVCNLEFAESGTLPGRCDICMTYYEEMTNTSNIPDFVSTRFIAEAKNVIMLNQPSDQMRAFIFAAQELNLPLWVYVRVNTDIPSVYEELIAATGGGVVYYLRDESYVDPVDRAAQIGILIASGVILLVVGGDMFVTRFRRSNAPETPKPPPQQAAKRQQRADVLQEAHRLKAAARRRADEADARDDLHHD